ncbi:MAG TPA: KpsF/GutQ family sugar-phosphate isomerase [Flavobacteriales bacterium]|nr:KpsF/GutQ family sugar-phosphate isomerase [Flavobacteriales bacterium]HRE95991.1 KpsF/GutQ family sugar-phosphate isomerase [Flavobacteriales bacterium]HRJ34827.1 KpsF/GutQ family sugar-phosphate isomerase [Flavobacteriales bacterium]HRJ38141.1 KpsF/GutQ family sugar-phosphate isomerase [Flavobacteriales bacterium]
MAASHRNHAREVFRIEAKAVADLSALLDASFDLAIETILRNKGRLVISGVGKSGIIARKIAATMASTGTPSLFMHPVEAFHGDLGMLKKEDVFLAISYSGETEELLRIVPFIRDRKIALLSITGNPKSTLARNSTAHLNVKVHKEACPLELAPTSSTTATLAMGDAMAVALMKARKFRSEDFAQFHPGGSLGRKLLTTVEQVMFREHLPLVTPTTTLSDVIAIMTKGRLGLAVVQVDKTVKGIITDGDLRRAMDKHKEKLFSKKASDIMTAKPRAIAKNMKLAEAEEMMSKLKIASLLVVEKNKLAGIVQLYSINND